MSETTVPYHQLVQQSGLIEPAVLKQVMEEIEKETGVRPADAAKLEARLLDRKLLTKWQQEQLDKGCFEGFFLGKYKLLDHLGSGGMGDVYLAEHKRLQRHAAIKVLPAALTENPQFLGRFYQEARATANLDHPNIVRAHDVDEVDDIHFLVMEYVQGEDLQARIQRSGWASFEETAKYIAQAAKGLSHAHTKKMIHRDIKPGNLLVDTEGTLKILDMGVARILDDEDHESLTLAGHEEVLGTVDYLAPEQLLDPHNVDGRADLYSLGCTMYYLLCGKAPFAEGTMAQRLMAHQCKEPPDLLELRPDVPAGLLQICYRLMAKSADDRYQNADELYEAVVAYQQNKAPVTPNPQADSPTVIDESETVQDSEHNTQLLLSQLVKQNVLTAYQAEALTESSSSPLTVGNYQIRERIAEGRLEGMFRGMHSKFHFPVCLKTVRLNEEDDQSETRLGKFQREARICIQLNHPNVIRTYDVGKANNICYLTLEELQGQSVREWMQSTPERDLQTVLRLVQEAAFGLAHLHEQQIVHRDINPDNLWLNEHQHVKVMDFSVAKDALHFLDDDCMNSKADSDEFLGTLDYLAPEQGIDGDNATPLSDVYSLGCTLYELLTGRVPFPEPKPAKKMLQHASGQAIPPSQLNPHVSPELDELVERMMAKKTKDRCQGAFIVGRLIDMFRTK